MENNEFLNKLANKLSEKREKREKKKTYKMMKKIFSKGQYIDLLIPNDKLHLIDEIRGKGKIVSITENEDDVLVVAKINNYDVFLEYNHYLKKIGGDNCEGCKNFRNVHIDLYIPNDKLYLIDELKEKAEIVSITENEPGMDVHVKNARHVYFEFADYAYMPPRPNRNCKICNPQLEENN